MKFIDELHESRQRGRCCLRVSVSVLLLLGIGCTAEPPPTMVYDQGGKPDVYAKPDSPVGCPSPPTLGAPIVEQYPNPTAYALQPFRGSAPGADLITARGGVGSAAPVKVGSDGKFCIEVTLLPDSPNSVVFSPLDANGCPGRETVVSIMHKSVAKADAGVSSIINVAKNAPVTSKTSAEEGALGNLVDGDKNSGAKFSFSDWWDPTGAECDENTWIRIDLGKSYTVSKLKVVWGPNVGSDYGQCYALLLSAKASPVDPDPAQASDWTVVKQDSAGDASELIVPLSPQSARWAALVLYENGSTGISETFRVAELEVWGQDPNATPPAPPDRCK
jgi:hypothetical protein